MFTTRLKSLGVLFFATMLFSQVLLTPSFTFAQNTAGHYEKDMLRFEKENAENPPTTETTFFVGSSTFTKWLTIPEDFKEFHAVNRGFGGSKINDWLDYACDRVLIEYKPRHIVFFCGCNDIAAGKSVEETFTNYKKFINKMRDANPNLTLHFCALHMPPIREKNWDAFRQFNTQAKALADADPNIYYIDFATATCDENGRGREELFLKDRLHLTREGEQILIPLIKESLEKARKDNAQKRKRILFGAVKGVAPKADRTETLQVPVNIKFNQWSLSLSEESDNILLQLFKSNEGHFENALAQTKIARTDVEKVEVHKISASNVNESATVSLKSGYDLIFSNVYENFGFITIDYRIVKEGVLGAESPLVWEFPSLTPKQANTLRAFGTAGLKKIDDHKGSYAFLSLVSPETRSGVVGGWVTSEIAGGVVKSGKTEIGAPTMTPQLDIFGYQNERVFSERFVLGAFDDCRIGLENYAEVIATYYSIRPNKDALNGYCTWYSDKHAGASDENSLRKLANSITKYFGNYGFQYVQIDDKWQLGASKNGPNKNFTAHNPQGPYPSGMKATAEYLNSNDLIAGIWFMPFSGSYNDPYWADKQDLFVLSAIDYPEEGRANTRRYSSINQKRYAPYETYWGGTSLDTSNPKTRAYIQDVVHRITQDWNYKFIKIDGMWVGGALEQLYVNDEYMPEDMGKQIFFDRTSTNIENFRRGLELVRTTAEDAFILGCNTSQNMRVLASSYGLVDAMRVGPDNGSDWKGVCAGPCRGTNRYFYNGRVWYNDPDPVYVRKSIPVERAQVSTTWAAITGQLYALSDWIPDYDQERIDIVRKTTPNHQCLNVRPVDLFDVDLARAWLLTDEKSGVRRNVLALFNWHGGDNEPFEYTAEKLGLPLINAKGEKIEQYVGYDFWNNTFVEPFKTLKTTLAKESCKVLAIRPVEDHPILLSTSRHITQGVVDVASEDWNSETKTLRIVTNIPEELEYELRVYNPAIKKLDRWIVPQEFKGVQTIEYKLDEMNKGTFTIVAK